MKKYILLILITFIVGNIRGQVLNLPLFPDYECGNWCWAISSRHIIYYYGYDNIKICEIAEYARSRNPGKFGTTNCCIDPNGSCCVGNFLSGSGGMTEIFQNWGINPNYIYRALTLEEIRTELSNNRPFIIRYPGHVAVGYGIDNGNNVYIRDPGWGTDIRNYNILIEGTASNNKWIHSIYMSNSPMKCPYSRVLSGTISATGAYKSSGYYDLSCSIINNAQITVKAMEEITISIGFSIGLGSSLSLEIVKNPNCP